MKRGSLAVVLTVAFLLQSLCACAENRSLTLYQNMELTAGEDKLPPSGIFLDCTFHVSRKPVLELADGAVFIGCRFICGSDTMLMASSGDGMVMVDCAVAGASCVLWSAGMKESDRNYLYDFKIDGQDEPDLYDCPQTVGMEGLRLADAFIYETENGVSRYNLANILGRQELEDVQAEQFLGRSLYGLPLRMRLETSDSKVDRTVTVCAKGLNEDMFIGWTVSDERLVLVPSADPSCCMVSLKDGTDDFFSAVVTACTEYGLEQAVTLIAGTEPQVVQPVQEKKKKGLFRRRKDR